jgi:S-adenosylmethionine uptake transporter
VKLASPFYSSWEIVFYRGLIGLAVVACLVVVRGDRDPVLRKKISHRDSPWKTLKTVLGTDKFASHARRSLSGTLAMVGWFFAVAHLPLATAVTLNYSSAILVGASIVYTAIRAGRKPSKTLIGALMCGFGGMLLVLQPTMRPDQWLYGFAGAASAVFAATAQLSVKALSASGEPESRIVFYFSGFNALVGLAGAIAFGFHPHSAYGVALLVGIGTIATLAQLAMTRAFGAGRTLLTANLSFLTIVFASVWGVLIFDDVMALVSIAGIAVIISSGIVASLYVARGAQLANRAVKP